jgi:NDP-sugar pyrophosphorylase family protein
MSTPEKQYILIVLCAGLGTRLRPLTDLIPKPVIPILSQPLATYTINKLLPLGDVHINTFHKASRVREELNAYYKKHPNSSHYSIHYHDEKVLLGTGGGIFNICENIKKQNNIKSLDKDIIVVSGDIYTQMDFNQIIHYWETQCQDAGALMTVRSLAEQRDDALSVNKGLVVGFNSLKSKSKSIGIKELSEPLNESEKGNHSMMFSNFQIISHKLYEKAISSHKEAPVISSVSLFYQKAITEKLPIIAYADESPWFNVGDPFEYAACLSSIGAPYQDYAWQAGCLQCPLEDNLDYPQVTDLSYSPYRVEITGFSNLSYQRLSLSSTLLLRLQCLS